MDVCEEAIGRLDEDYCYNIMRYGKPCDCDADWHAFCADLAAPADSCAAVDCATEGVEGCPFINITGLTFREAARACYQSAHARPDVGSLPVRYTTDAMESLVDRFRGAFANESSPCPLRHPNVTGTRNRTQCLTDTAWVTRDFDNMTEAFLSLEEGCHMLEYGTDDYRLHADLCALPVDISCQQCDGECRLLDDFMYCDDGLKHFKFCQDGCPEGCEHGEAFGFTSGYVCPRRECDENLHALCGAPLFRGTVASYNAGPGLRPRILRLHFKGESGSISFADDEVFLSIYFRKGSLGLSIGPCEDTCPAEILPANRWLELEVEFLPGEAVVRVSETVLRAPVGERTIDTITHEGLEVWRLKMGAEISPACGLDMTRHCLREVADWEFCAAHMALAGQEKPWELYCRWEELATFDCAVSLEDALRCDDYLGQFDDCPGPVPVNYSLCHLPCGCAHPDISGWCEERRDFYDADGVKALDECPGDWASYDWQSFCFATANGKVLGTCSGASCQCDSFGSSGPACDVRCPVNPDGSVCGEASGLGRCQPVEGVYNTTRTDHIPGECKCSLLEASPTKGCDISCDDGAQCNPTIYGSLDGADLHVSRCAAGACECLPPLVSEYKERTMDWRGKEFNRTRLRAFGNLTARYHQGVRSFIEYLGAENWEAEYVRFQRDPHLYDCDGRPCDWYDAKLLDELAGSSFLWGSRCETPCPGVKLEEMVFTSCLAQPDYDVFLVAEYDMPLEACKKTCLTMFECRFIRMEGLCKLYSGCIGDGFLKAFADDMVVLPCSGRGRCTTGGQCVCVTAKYVSAEDPLTGAVKFVQSNSRDVFQSDTRLDHTPFRGDDCSVECPGWDGVSMASVCSNRGLCNYEGECECNPGFVGRSCEYECPNGCSGHGVCELATQGIPEEKDARTFYELYEFWKSVCPADDFTLEELDCEVEGRFPLTRIMDYTDTETELPTILGGTNQGRQGVYRKFTSGVVFFLLQYERAGEFTIMPCYHCEDLIAVERGLTVDECSTLCEANACGCFTFEPLYHRTGESRCEVHRANVRQSETVLASSVGGLPILEPGGEPECVMPYPTTHIFLQEGECDGSDLELEASTLEECALACLGIPDCTFFSFGPVCKYEVEECGSFLANGYRYYTTVEPTHLRPSPTAYVLEPSHRVFLEPHGTPEATVEVEVAGRNITFAACQCMGEGGDYGHWASTDCSRCQAFYGTSTCGVRCPGFDENFCGFGKCLYGSGELFNQANCLCGDPPGDTGVVLRGKRAYDVTYLDFQSTKVEVIQDQLPWYRMPDNYNFLGDTCDLCQDS